MSLKFEFGVDFELLRQQKQWLLSVRPDEKYPLVDGVIHLIDTIQDQAVAQGVSEAEVFGKEYGHADQ